MTRGTEYALPRTKPHPAARSDASRTRLGDMWSVGRTFSHRAPSRDGSTGRQSAIQSAQTGRDCGGGR
jgi:hypothetical protein